MKTVYRFSRTKEKWDIIYLKQQNVSDEELKANLYNACLIDCVGLCNCYANSLCKEEDFELEKIAEMLYNLLDENFRNKSVESAELITAFIAGCALAACETHNNYCIKKNKYDCFTLFC